MATQAPATAGIGQSAGLTHTAPPRLVLEVLHDWVTTVDHKKIGLMYIGYALIFLVIAGFEALLMRIQLAIPNNHFVSPQVFNQLFTMHGTTMVFFVGMPVLFGFGNYLIPLMIGARDMAFPRLNAFSFWIVSLGGILLYFSYLGGQRALRRRGAPDVGWFAYAPLTARVFSPGHSTDYWTLAILLSGIGSIGTAVNIVATTICMRCPGMTLTRMPLLVWLYLVMSCLVFVTISPLTAAQIMLMLDRYARLALLRYAGGGLRRAVDALLLDLRPSRSLRAHPAFVRLRQRDHPRLLAQGHLRLSRNGRGLGRHRLHQPQRLGPPYVHGRHDRRRQHLLHPRHHGHLRPDRDQNFQLAGHAVGRQDPLHRVDDVLP